MTGKLDRAVNHGVEEIHNEAAKYCRSVDYLISGWVSTCDLTRQYRQQIIVTAEGEVVILNQFKCTLRTDWMIRRQSGVTGVCSLSRESIGGVKAWGVREVKVTCREASLDADK